ncbi:putative Ig domain-containing protein [Streptomyces sp. NPDC051561]|uniref:putative Ig domain-containing protein n=1 Tax=Streptomyces sp. NPDC051561 TaxID=3365658 RepID=UPI0037AEAD1A
MRPFPHRAVTAAVAACAALVALGSVPAHAGPTGEPLPLPPGVEKAMMRDLHLSPGALRTRIDQESTAARTATAVRARVGDRVAGLWFDASDGRLHAAVTTEADAAAVRAAGAVAQRAAHSPAALDQALRAVSARAAAVPGVLSWGPDARAGQILVQVDPSTANRVTSDFLAGLAVYGNLVRVAESSDVPRQQGGEVRGGEKWVPGSESPCSIGFPVTRTSGGSKAFLTAGHCTNDVSQPAYGKDGTRVGTSNKNGSGSVNAREGDMGIVDVDQAGWELAGVVSGWGKADIPVTGSAEAVVGTSVCRSGQTSGLQCGEVTKVNQSVDYGNVVIDGLSYSNACSAGGDSGGSYVTAAGGKAVGLHSGGGSATCSGGSGEKFTIFQPVNEALSKFGAGLVTSTPQPGEVTVAAVSDRSTAVNTAAEIRNSAEGGTAPYTWSATGLPAGTSLAASTGTVTGSPTAAGTSNVTVTATDSAGRKGSTSFTWTITPANADLALAAPGNQSATVAKAASLTLRASGGSTPYTYSATGLPAGLSLAAATGVVSGTPTTAGTSTVNAKVTDSTGRSASTLFSWTVAPAGGTTPVLTNPGSQNVYVGRPVRLPLAVTGGSAPYSFTATNLPAGLTIAAGTGVVSGTPTAWGSRNAVLTVTDAAGTSSRVTVTFTVWS